MLNSKLKKILLSLFFLSSISLILILYRYLNITTFSGKEILLFIAIIFAVMLLFFTSLIESDNKHTKKSDKKKMPVNKADEIVEKKEQPDTGRNMSDNLLKNLQNSTTVKQFGETLLKNFSDEFSIVRGLFYKKNRTTGLLEPTVAYAGYNIDYSKPVEIGEGICGQVAQNRKPDYIKNIADGYITVVSGLGSTSASNLLILPFVINNETVALLEVSAFEDFPSKYLELWNSINKPIAEKIISFKENE
jgi:hypothetical protein